jgi:hypothetical protein
MEDQKYNGWSNWATWSAYNWLTHTEELYLIASQAKNIGQLKRLWNIRLAGKDYIKPSQINFKEILDSFKD